MRIKGNVCWVLSKYVVEPMMWIQGYSKIALLPLYASPIPSFHPSI